jgi:putative ABC transport system permease protein
MRQRAVSSWLTGLSMALGVALVVTVLVVLNTVDKTFRESAQGFDLIVGAKGGSLQLVLNTIYHLSQPIENLPYDFYLEFKEGGRYYSAIGTQGVAIPYCLGDNYQGFRVVGTTSELFEIEYRQGQKYEFAAGRNFKDEHYFEAVIGWQVARNTDPPLEVGDTFRPVHGVVGDEGHKHDAFQVVGILAPTGTPNDRALFVNMEGFYLLEGHASEPPQDQTAAAQPARPPAPAGAANPPAGAQVREGAAPQAGNGANERPSGEPPARGSLPVAAVQAQNGQHDPDDGHNHEPAPGEEADINRGFKPLPIEQREITALLIRTADPLSGEALRRHINEKPIAQAVAPMREIYKLFDEIIGNVRIIMLFLSVLIVVVAGIGIMVSIYNSMYERRREIAIMRALGAGRGTVMAVILVESILLALVGGAGGYILGHGMIGALSPFIADLTGVVIRFWDPGPPLEFSIRLGSKPQDLWIPYEVVLTLGLMFLAALAGFVPALTAYRTDVAKALASSP